MSADLFGSTLGGLTWPKCAASLLLHCSQSSPVVQRSSGKRRSRRPGRGHKESAHGGWHVASDRLAINTISEWASPNFHAIAFAPLAIGIAVLLIVGLPLGRRHLFGLLLSLVVVGMALTAQRNIALFAIVFPVVASQSIAERWPSQMHVARPGVNGLNWAICVVTLLLTVAMLPSIGGQVYSEPNVSNGLPSEGVAYIREHSLGTRMLNSYDWGGYLIDELYPGVKVSIDGRSDLYGDAILNQYLTITNLKPGWREELAALNPDFILMPKDSPLAGELRYDAGWRLAFEGHVEMIFVPAKTSLRLGGQQYTGSNFVRIGPVR